MKEKLRPQLKQIVDKLPLEKFIPAAFMIFLLLFVILTIIIYNSVNSYRDNLKWVNHTHEVLNTIDEITLSLTHVQLDRRGYIVKADSKYLSDYYTHKNRVKEKFSRLRELTKDNPSQSELVSRLESLADVSIAYLDSSIAHFDIEKKIVQPVQTAMTMESQGYLDEYFPVTKDLKDQEINLLNQRQETANQNLSDTQVFIVAGSLFVFIVLGLSLFISTALIRNKNIAEKLLKKSYDELENNVEERTSELLASNQSLVSEINNRIKIEQSLRESEERFRQMADSAPVMIWMTDRNKLCTYLNKVWLDFTGRMAEQDLGNCWTENIYQPDLKKFHDIYNSAFDKREEFEMEYRLKTFLGDYRWVLNRGLPRYEGDEFIGYIGSCIDIHSKKRNERYLRIQYTVSKALAESKTTQEALDLIIENICVELDWEFGMIWLVEGDKINQRSQWARESKIISQYSELVGNQNSFEKGIGLPGRIWKYNKSLWIQDIESDNNVARKKSLLNAGMKSGLGFPIVGNEILGVIECFNKTSLTPKQDLLQILETVGRQIGSFIERKRVEEELKESYDKLENRVKERTLELADTLNKLLSEMSDKEKIQNKLKLYAHAVKGIKECVYITDLDNNTLFVNSSFEEIYGYTEDELLGKKIPILFSDEIPGELRNEILSQSSRDGWKGELKNKRKNGSEIDVYLSTSAVRNEEGDVQALVGICQDITESLEQKELLIKRNSLLKLLNEVITVTNRSFNIQASVSYALNKMCEYTDWDVGHCYFVEEDRLVSSKIWNGNLSQKFLEYKNFSEELTFKRGEGIPGICYENNESYWIKFRTLDDESKFKRSEIAKKAGLKTGVWAPIKKGNKVVGVLEFFNIQEKEQDNEVLDSINNIGVELGSLFERNEILSKISESELNLRLLIENVKDYALIRLDNEGHIVSWNKAAETIKGYKADEIIGKHFSIFYTDDEINENEPEINLTLARQLGRFEREGWRVRKDGTLFLADIIFTPLTDDEGNPAGYVKVTRDITDRKKAEEIIIESEKQLKEAQKTAKLGNWEWDVKTNSVKWSDEMYSIYEVNQEGFKLTYESFLSRLHPEDIEYVKSQIETAYKNKAAFEFYERILTPKGEIKILRSQGSAKADENGNVIKLVGTCLDITEMKRAEEIIVESEKQLKTAQKIAKLGSWDWNIKTDKIRWSDEMYNIFEIEPGTEITTEKYLELLDEENKAARSDAISKAMAENKPFGYYLKVTTKSGMSKILNSMGEVETDKNGDIVRIVGTVIDVTEVKQAEEEVKNREKQLKDAQQIAKLGSWEVDIKTGNITWSEEMYRIFNIDMSEAPRPYEGIRSFIHPNDVGKVDEALNLLEASPGDIALNFRITVPNGKLKFLAADIRVELDENSNQVRLYGSIQDITEIKLVEEELRKTNLRLIEAQKELVHNEKLAALGRFSSGIAHEIRNPLANISALAQLLSKSKIEDEKMKKHLKYILINADIANNIIKDLLHFASPEDLVFKEENINTVLDNIVNSIEPRAAENKVRVSKNIPVSLPEIYIDKTRLENALLNFISNSIDAMPEGGNLTVNAKADKTSEEVIINVIDNGEGIPQENLDKIFEPFFTTKETGTGLGLGLAYQTIKLHQGVLNISSEPGKGTDVEIKLPIRKNINGKNINN